MSRACRGQALTETLLALPLLVVTAIGGAGLFAHQLDQLRCDQRSFREARKKLLDSDSPAEEASVRCRSARSSARLSSLEAVLSGNGGRSPSLPRSFSGSLSRAPWGSGS